MQSNEETTKVTKQYKGIPVHFRLIPNEELQPQLKLLSRDRIQAAINLLTDRSVDRKTAVHQSRRCLKELRALLILFNNSLPEKIAKEAADQIRDIAGMLAGARDADVMLATYMALRARVGQTDKGMDERLEQYFSDSNRKITNTQIQKCIKQLERLRKHTGKWKHSDEGFKAIADGLEATYRRGLKRMKASMEIPSSELLHEWRKMIKAWQHSTRLLRLLWPVMMKSWQSQLAELAGMLGAEHDLAMLEETLRELDLVSGPSRLSFLSAIDTERVSLREQSWLLGKKLYLEKPSAYMKRMAALWNAAV